MPRGRLAAGAAAAVALAVAAGFAGDRLVSRSSEPAKAERPPAGRTDLPRGFREFKDRQARFSIGYPSDWVRLPTSGGDLRLLAAKAGASFSMRVSRVGIEIGPQSLGPARTITDKLVGDAGPIKLLRKPEQITLGGLPGFLYLYAFRDAETRQRGIHAHYFLFRGKQLYALVFQALPATTFPGLTKTFDSIADTLRVTPPKEGLTGA